MRYDTVNRYRTNRGKLLRKQIDHLADHLGRDIVILDVGGRPDYWDNVGVDRIARIDLVNHDSAELDREIPAALPQNLFVRKLGDARALADYADNAVDLVHSNSVIEHVGRWSDMTAMANELMRVAPAGWVQTPAWEFPIEPHFRAPFLHWFGAPMRARMLSLSFDPRHRKADLHRRRRKVEMVNLLSKGEVRALFPDRPIYVERVILAKSYTVRWMPEGVPV